MLVLTRKRTESIVIAGDIIITVLEVRGDRVRLGVEAPREVPVHRREIVEWEEARTILSRSEPFSCPPLAESCGLRSTVRR